MWSHFCKCGSSVLWTNSHNLWCSAGICVRIVWGWVTFTAGVRGWSLWRNIWVFGGNFWRERGSFLWGCLWSYPGSVSASPSPSLRIQRLWYPSPWLTHRPTRRQVPTRCTVCLESWVNNFLALLLTSVCVAEIRAYFAYRSMLNDMCSTGWLIVYT